MDTHPQTPQDLVGAIDFKIRKLRQELTFLLDQRAKVVQLVELSRELGLPVPATLPAPLPLPLPQPTFTIAVRKVDAARPHSEQSIKALASNRVAEYLSDGFREKTATLLSKLDADGIQVGGKDRILTLSAILSKDERFEASRKYGWGLKMAPKTGPQNEEQP